jgi:hypothetical protein
MTMADAAGRAVDKVYRCGVVINQHPCLMAPAWMDAPFPAANCGHTPRVGH